MSVTAYKIDFEYSNDFRFVDALIYFFAKTQTQFVLSERECAIIREYVMRGYSDETKRHIEKSFNIKPTNLNTYNCNLQKKGFLLPHTKNQNNKLLNPELLKLRQFFEADSQKKVLLVNFIDQNR